MRALLPAIATMLALSVPTGCSRNQGQPATGPTGPPGASPPASSVTRTVGNPSVTITDLGTLPGGT